MNEVHAVFSPIFGIALEGIDELNLGSATLFRNPAALSFLQTDLESALERDGVPTPNVRVPYNIHIQGAPPAPFDSDLRQLGIAKYLIEIEIETPTNELPGKCVKEELEWAVLPLRILTGARVLTGLSEYCQGGCVHSSLARGEIIERVRREGILAPAPIPQGASVTGTITREASGKITAFASVVNGHRDVLSVQLAVPIDTFSNSFYLASYTDRGINLLILLEALFSERRSKRGIRDKVAKRIAIFLDGDKERRKQTQCLIIQSFDVRKDIEHGSKAKGSNTEEYFMHHLKELEDVVRSILFKAVCLSNQRKDLISILPGLRKASTSGRNKAK